MRITNNIILHNTSNNINGNKINVDNLNNQMSSQKKIQRPSEDPVIAIRALRLRSSLSEIDQYYEKNIPDAESWLDVTETAILNMKDILTTIRTQCEYGANDSLTTDNRKTILTQLEKLREQVYSEGNADYAGRTVFTGYRTNKKLTFMENELTTSYKISQKLSYSSIEEHRYYGNDVEVPKKDDILPNPNPNPTPVPDPVSATFDRIRLPYDGIDSITVTDDITGDETAVAANGATVVIDYSYEDANGATQTNGALTVTIYDTYDSWLAASGNGVYEVAANGAVFIKDTGELILGTDASATLKSSKAELDFNYTKTGFDRGELRPEYYFNCTNVTDPANHITYEKYDAEGNEIYQDINYMVAANQTITVNTNASDVFDASLGRDVDELIDAVQRSLDANQTVEDIQAMMKQEQYSSDECQAKLEEWLAAAQKEADYADDNMQKLYNSYIGKCDKYLEKVNLALTEVGSKGQSLELTKNRMSNQQTTIEELKSTNEDRDLSDIIIDYTSAYTAYQASLQAASMINQVTLLSYL